MSDWRHRAACRDQDPETWFPIGTTGPSLLWIEDAKAICNGSCPVVAECLQYALDQNMSEGVWGGKSEDERRALKRRASRAAARTRSHTPELHAQAVESFRAHRSQYSSDEATCRAVAKRLGIEQAKTVREWARDAGLIGRAASAEENEERRRAVVARVEAVRGGHVSDHAAHVAVAAEFGVHADTVRAWVVAARKSRVLVTTNGIKEN